MSDEWTIVKGGKRMKGGNKPNQAKGSLVPLTISHDRDGAEVANRERASRLHEAILGMRTQIKTCIVGRSLEAALTHIPSSCNNLEELIIYGLGSMEDSIVSRWQLALALALRDLLSPQASALLKTSAYDPAFSPCDLLIMQSLSIDVIQVNEECRRLAQTPTFFYMPHCEHHLYDGLVSLNLSAGLLKNVIILGNSFERYGESLNGLKPRQIMDLVARGCINEIDIPSDVPKRSRDDEPPYPEGAFNNTSLHLFHREAEH